MNDMVIIATITAIFIAIGVALPFVQQDFDVPVTNNDPDTIIAPGDSTTSVGAFQVIGSVFKMFFWTFGALPVWLDSIFVGLRIILALTIARNLWVGGGG
jgi:hypothetical protein